MGVSAAAIRGAGTVTPARQDGGVPDADGQQPRYRYMCEVCGRTETLSAAAAYDAGWDMPPRMGDFGTVSPRVCPRCPMLATAWFAMAMRGCALEDLTDRQRAAIERILGEPESLMLTPEAGGGPK